ncbi:hypothetical protein M917_2818 [Psychrobacter aquaticus CMS 56]|uniref:Uncharacterized protein n=1 Tax=Psychrobacter aquaticus CMS 56 TaxID=1354303 RepID=U4T742_9GAMM|nr:hypothetical protein M917_2818 [Psychrobacter aquaticus CMS 56]
MYCLAWLNCPLYAYIRLGIIPVLLGSAYRGHAKYHGSLKTAIVTQKADKIE